MTEELELVVNGQRYAGWTAITVTRSLEQLAASFKLEFHEQWSASAKPIPIEEGMKCAVAVDGEFLLEGHVDDADLSYDDKTHQMSVSGRSKAGDLVDCSAIHKTGAWKKQGLLQIAKDLCAPFGVDVRAETDLGEPLEAFALQDSETVHEAIERVCRMRGLVLMSAADGDVVFTRAGKARSSTVIKRGVNVLRGAREGSWKERFSAYTVKSQSAGSDTLFGEGAAVRKAAAKDLNVDRYRPLIVMAEHGGSLAELHARATWERNVRAGKAERLKYRLQGWRDDSRAIWKPNTLVRVVDDWLRVDAELLILGVTLARDDSGTTTELEIARKEAVSVEPYKRKRKGRSNPFADMWASDDED